MACRFRHFCPPASSWCPSLSSYLQNLPEGYGITDIIGTIKAGPVEAIIPGDDQLTIRFLSEELARKYVKSRGTGLEW